MWQCKEHNQDEWECGKIRGKDEYYHVQRCKAFELDKSIEIKPEALIPIDYNITIINDRKRKHK